MKEMLLEHNQIKAETYRTRVETEQNKVDMTKSKISQLEISINQKNSEFEILSHKIENLENSLNLTTDQKNELSNLKEQKNKLEIEKTEKENLLNSENQNLLKNLEDLNKGVDFYNSEVDRLDREFIIKKTEFLEGLFFEINFTIKIYFDDAGSFLANSDNEIFGQIMNQDLNLDNLLMVKKIKCDKNLFSPDFNEFLMDNVKIDFLKKKFQEFVSYLDKYFLDFKEIFLEMISKKNIVFNIMNKILNGESIFDLNEDDLKEEIVVQNVNFDETDDYFLFDEMIEESDFYRIYLSKLFFLDLNIQRHNKFIPKLEDDNKNLIKKISNKNISKFIKKITKRLSIDELILQNNDFIFIASTKNTRQLKISRIEEVDKTIKYKPDQKRKNKQLLEKYTIDLLTDKIKKYIPTRNPIFKKLNSNYIEKESISEEKTKKSKKFKKSSSSSSIEELEEIDENNYNFRIEKKNSIKLDLIKEKEKKYQKTLYKEFSVFYKENKKKFFTMNGDENKKDPVYQNLISKLGLGDFVDPANGDYYCLVGKNEKILELLI